MDTDSDMALLRRFEPILRYTRGERFFPMEVEPYVRACSLWIHRPTGETTCLVPAGELTIEKLTQPRAAAFGAVHFLRIAEPLSLAKLAAYSLFRGQPQSAQDGFRAGRGRLARVGFVSRFVDALFSLTLLARGRVPGDAAAAASIVYARIMADAPARERYCYYGRVARQEGWIVLQYWFFYAFNNWRSGFFGVNDHEADWEMLCLYLSESKSGEIRPEWIASTAHDVAGDDLRRRWDDPEVEKVGEHPIIYVGSGSHAGYFAGGEYMVEVAIPFLAPIAKAADAAQRFWHGHLHQYGGDGEAEPGRVAGTFRVPFVDYARGDGVTLGPGQQWEWSTPRLLDPLPMWASDYRGLWGLYVHDPLGGENAPSGPMYNRDGTVRRAWHDPLGWAGLDKVPAPEQELETVLQRQAEVKARQSELQAQIEAKTAHLKRLGVEVAAMRGQPHLGKLYAAQQKQISKLAGEVRQLRAQMTTEQALLDALERHAARLRAGERGPLRAHIHRARRPTSSDELKVSRLVEFWAAVSIGLMLMAFVAVVLFARDYLLWGLVAIVALFTFIESGFRRQLTNLVSSVAIGLSVAAALVLLYEFFWQTVSLVVLIAGGYILLDNVREFLA